MHCQGAQKLEHEEAGSIQLQLFMAREIIAQLDTTQDYRQLSDEECDLRRELKPKSLGLASLARTIAQRQCRIPNTSTYKPITGTARTSSPPFSMKASTF